MDVPIDVSQVEIRTARLVLRPWRPEDLADLYAYASVEGVGEMAGWRHHESPADSEAILKIFISEKTYLRSEATSRRGRSCSATPMCL